MPWNFLYRCLARSLRICPVIAFWIATNFLAFSGRASGEVALILPGLIGEGFLFGGPFSSSGTFK